MTEPIPTYYSRESHLQAHIVQRLKGAGWFVVVTSQDRASRAQLAGLPDLLAVRRNVVLFVECKTPEGAMRESQIDFLEQMQEHTGPNVIHVVARYPQDVEAWCR